MIRTRTHSAALLSALIVVATSSPASAHHPGCGGHHRSFSVGVGFYGLYGPGYWGYDLDDLHPGYYGGARYREYYNYGRGAFGPYPGLVGVGVMVPLRPAPMQAIPTTLVPGSPDETMPSVMASSPLTAKLLVQVPGDAEVWIEGTKMSQSGSLRSFVTPPLEPGQEYEYEVKARWIENDQPKELSRSVPLRAGQQARLTFRSSQRPEELPAPRQLPHSLAP